MPKPATKPGKPAGKSASKSKEGEKEKVVAQNRAASYNYDILDKLEAGINARFDKLEASIARVLDQVKPAAPKTGP